MNATNPIKNAVLGCALAAALALTGLTGCAIAGDAPSEGGSKDAASAASTESQHGGSTTFSQVSYTADGEVQILDVESLFSDRDLDPSYDEAEVVEITLTGDSATVDGSGASVSGSTITISSEGVYRISGTLTDGQVIVDVPDTAKVQIILDGASITNSSSAAVRVIEADKVFITLEGANSLATTGAFEDASDSSIDGVIFSRSDLTIAGDGSLEISSTAHGIVGKDELTLVSGTIVVSAEKSGIRANDSIAIASGSYTISAGTDGIHCENSDDSSLGFIFIGGGSFDISAASDAIDASNSIQINDCSMRINAGDDGIHADLQLVVNGGTIGIESSVEGLESATITMAGGEVDVVSSDDGVNARGTDDASGTTDAASGQQAGMGGMGGMAGGMMDADASAVLTISGGTLTVDSSGDGLDSNGYVYITGGTVLVSGPTSDGESPLDYGIACEVSGGTVVVVGSSGMLEPFTSGSTQANVSMALDSSASGTVRVLDASGNVLVEYTPTKSYHAILVSAPGMEVGGTVTIVHGEGSTELTLDNVCTTSGAMGMGMGGQPGGMGGQMPGGGMGGQMPDGQIPGGQSGQMPEPPSGGQGGMGSGRR
ncbi:MAG: carbohydrate-binding domain-containing protein [Atopobiaceae bacterium]|nr:carbohydrate-binding domain-containing protein [Atopobiaceae bacterium]